MYADTLDSIEIKWTALIFAEHQKLSIENPLLKQQILSLEELNSLYMTSDSLQRKEIDLYKEQVSSDNKKINKLKSNQKKIIIISSITSIVLFLTGLFL